MSSNASIKLSEKCRFMKICGVDIVGCPDTGVIIGIDNEGSELINKLKTGLDLETEGINNYQRLLLAALVDNGFCSNNPKTYRVKRSYFHVTSHCNLNCEGCYSFENDRNRRQDLTLSEIKSILDNLVEAGLTDLVISGGEPFVRSDIVDILKYAKEDLRIQSVQCITNGTAPIESYVKASKFLDMLTFSLDSPDRESSEIRPAAVFDTVVDKIKAIKAHRANVSIVFTIHHKNVHRCDELCTFANELGVKFRFSIFTVLEFNSVKSPLRLTDDDYDILQEFIANNMPYEAIGDSPVGAEIGCVLACGAGKTDVSISSDGHIYPCHMFVGMEQFCLGSALTSKITDVVNSISNNPFLTLNVDSFEKCKECHVRYVCGGGCRFRSYAVHNSIYHADKLCNTYIRNKEQCIMKLLNP